MKTRRLSATVVSVSGTANDGLPLQPVTDSTPESHQGDSTLFLPGLKPDPSSGLLARFIHRTMGDDAVSGDQVVGMSYDFVARQNLKVSAGSRSTKLRRGPVVSDLVETGLN